MELHRIKNTVKRLMSLLIEGNYAEAAALANNRRLTEKDIAESLCEYGGIYIMPPESEFEKLDVIEVVNREPREWSVNINFWTVEEGRSDLTLELTVADNETDIFKVEIDGIHTL